MTTITELAAVEERIRSLRLTSGILRDAILAGEFERASCTSLDPPSAHGYEAWRWTVRRLREQLLPLGWRSLDEHNLPLVVDPRTGVAVAVASGDHRTGDAEKTPTTKYRKGTVTQNYIRLNRKQLLLFGDKDPRFVPTPPEGERMTWILLVNSSDNLARCELSFPAAIDEDGFIDEWRERLILESVHFDEGPTRKRTPREVEELDVPVSRRAKSE